jgi:SAM-dependent methyltransferase
MTSHDLFQTINDQDRSVVDLFITRLEFRGKDPTFNSFRDAYLDRMHLELAGSVLDLGCGTGVVTRAVLRRPEFGGRIAGVDQSPPLVEAARRIAEEEGLGGMIDFRVGDVHALDFPDAAFDAVIAHTTVSHVRDLAATLAEAVRVLKPGGTLAVFDGDYASLTFGHPDHQLAFAMEEGLRAVMVAHPRSMRDLPRLLHAAGLELLETLPSVLAETGRGSFFPNFAESYGPLVARYGILPPEQVQAWLEEQRRAQAEGYFFAACNYYAYIARLTGP